MDRNFTVFYSWQSDAPPKQNRFFIRDALNNAIKKLNKAPQVEYQMTFRYDSDTKGKSGAVDIASTILDKIDQSDVFLCDITTINSSSRRCRKTPNPNVAIELGYAASQMGWESIICLFNTALGRMPADLPFDIYTRRVLSYHCGPGDSSAELIKLTDALAGAIRSMTDTQSAQVLPPNPRDFRKEKNKRDQQTITELLSQVHISSFDAFIEHALQGVVTERILFFWEGFTAYFNSSYFHLYNGQLAQLVTNLHSAWADTLSYHSYMNPIRAGYIFSEHNRHYDPKGWDTDRAAFDRATRMTHTAWRVLLNYIRDKYPMVDLRGASIVAANKYNAEHEPRSKSRKRKTK